MDSREVSDGIVLDYDKDGNLTGIDIDQASVKLNITELILSYQPKLLKSLNQKLAGSSPAARTINKFLVWSFKFQIYPWMKRGFRYFEEEDILHLVISDEPESRSVELSPNITVELNEKNEMIGVEILKASAFLRDTVLESVQAKTLQLFGADASWLQAMRISYYEDTDSLYIDLSSKPSVDSREVSDGIVLDYDKDGNLTGIDIDHANVKFNITELILSKLPAEVTQVA